MLAMLSMAGFSLGQPGKEEAGCGRLCLGVISNCVLEEGECLNLRPAVFCDRSLRAGPSACLQTPTTLEGRRGRVDRLEPAQLRNRSLPSSEQVPEAQGRSARVLVLHCSSAVCMPPINGVMPVQTRCSTGPIIQTPYRP